jgi:DNA-directed RNA polymerase specialized sigma24 family protein
VGALEQPFEVDPVVAIYRRTLPHVSGYLLTRCGSAVVAEYLTADTFLAEVTASRQGSVAAVNVAWLVRVARHKLVDHWRRVARTGPVPALLVRRRSIPTAPAIGT